ncbi:MAG TPA: phosphotransferase family protein [Thermoanaerobaculia bacterium]|nr:phosphotransferase family protein [Thermoanaerobaculia bacterium]
MSEPAAGGGEEGPLPVGEELESGLLCALRPHLRGARAIEGLRLLSGGASQESWSFDAVLDDGRRRGLILRRAPGAKPGPTLPKRDEAGLQVLARAAGVPVAEIVYVLEAGDGIGAGYVMQRVEGESIARRILRGDELAHARTVLARQCGEAAARIHSIDRGVLPELRVLEPATLLDHYRQLSDSYGDPHPVFEWAFRWLEERAPPAGDLRLVHGDFRHGNLMIGPDGLRAVLDWEGAHLGDPMEDLGWICVYSWRFGAEPPVGGFGRREDLFAGYEAAGGGEVDPAHVRWWEIFGSLRWGIICQSQGFSHLQGYIRSVERAAIGRRSSETEVDLLNLILVEEGL